MIPSQPKQRPWLQFRLRTLLVLVAIVSVYLAYEAYQDRQQREVVSSLLGAGGTVRYDYEKADATIPNVFDPQAEPWGPEWLKELGTENFQDVIMVNLRDKPITDDDLVQLKKLPKLENLDLSNTQVTSRGMAHIAKLKNLKYLSLWNTRVDDEGLQYLAGLDNLYALILDGTRVTDKGLIHLEGLVNLEEWLGLTGTGVTDAGLEHLKGLVKLRNLNLRQTNVTADGARELQRALPKADISYGP